MNYYLAKTEPNEYSIDDLERDVISKWTGVNNPQARNFLKSMKTGDTVYIYHTGKVKAIVGKARVHTPGVVPTFQFLKKFDPPLVTLSEIKKEPRFSDLRIVRQSRLSVMDLPSEFVAFLESRG